MQQAKRLTCLDCAEEARAHMLVGCSLSSPSAPSSATVNASSVPSGATATFFALAAASSALRSSCHITRMR